MKNLIEILRIVSQRKVRKIEVSDAATLETQNSKFSEFYQALSSNKYKNDRDAATHLYKCNPTDDKYRKLKSRFRKRLLNTLFFIDINLPDTSNYDRAYFSCNKDWTLVKILLSNEAFASAEDLAKQILQTALKFKFADIIVNCCRILRQQAAENGQEAEFEEYDGHIKQFSNILEAEIRSEELFQRVILKYRKPTTEIESLKAELYTYCEALVGLSEMYDSPVVNYNMYLIWTYRYEMQRDFKSMLEVCERAEGYIATNPDYYQDGKLATFQLKKMSAYLHTQDFRNGKVTVEKSLQAFPEGSQLWYLFLDYYLLLAFHTGNYIAALAIFNRAMDNALFRKLDHDTRDRWKIYEVYLHYFLESETDQGEMLKAQTKRHFKQNRFLADPLIYPKEQRSISVHLVIAQVLFFIHSKQFTEAKDQVDRLKSYTTRQLDQEVQQRAILFIRLLQLLAKSKFMVGDLVGSEKFYDKLVEQPFFYRGHILELEVVPFEQLWNHILKKLS